MINIICVKWGTKYTSIHVDRLYYMLKKNLTIPFNFYCYTDNPEDLSCNIIYMPDDGLEMWWPKLRMFEDGFGGLKGKCLFFDLDVIIQNNIDFLGFYDSFHMIECFWKFNITTTYESGMRQKEAYDMNLNSSCMVWNAGENVHIWNYFWNDPEKYMMKYKGIDRFLYHENLINKTFPEGIFYSRKHGVKKGDMPKLGPPWFYEKDYSVCLLNGFYHIDRDLFYEWNPYGGLEKYYE
tara:strand:+ start:430 stop:1140 length:711 start_codon:yes stop_codon:yes gene_type:complete